MTFTNIKKRIASNLGYVDSTGAILTTKDITETDIGNWVNDRYLDDCVAQLSTQYPEDYEVTSKASFYKATGTVAATSTDYTLDASTAIFNNTMVGDHVYNSTDEELARITGYTDTTTVTIDTEIDDTWDGDTIYVLGHEFAVGGDATDMRSIRYVGVAYSDDAVEKDLYRTCLQLDYNQVFQNGNEVYSEVAPIFYLSTSMVSSVPYTDIGILPEPKVNVSNGIKLRYVQLPAALSADADVPRMPLGSHSLLVVGGTSDALRKQLRYEEADAYEVKYQMAKQEMLATYALTRQAQTPRMRPSSNLRQMLDHTR